MVVKRKGRSGASPWTPDIGPVGAVCEDGSLFGEYTLVACTDHVLAPPPGDTVSNLSSARALDDIAERHGADAMPARW